MQDPEQITWAKLAVNGALALAGGIVHEIGRGKFSMLRYIGGGVVGTFTGLIVYCFAKHYGLSEYMTAALTGLGGYAGSPLLDVMSGAAKKFIERTFK